MEDEPAQENGGFRPQQSPGRVFVSMRKVMLRDLDEEMRFVGCNPSFTLFREGFN